MDDAGEINGAYDLLRVIERAAVALLKGQARVVVKLFAADGTLPGERMLPAEVDVRAAVYEVMEFQLSPAQELVYRGAVKIAEIEYADLASERRDILDDVARFRLADGKLVF